MPDFTNNDFIFSPKFHVARHVSFWIVHTILFSILWMSIGYSFERNLVHMGIWFPVMVLYTYPLISFIIPRFLLSGRYTLLVLALACWAIAGFFINYLFRAYIFIPVESNMGFATIRSNPWAPGSLLAMLITAAAAGIITLGKYGLQKQHDWLTAEKEKVSAELQLLKAQLHPHFLFNILNNIYSFSLENSKKTPALILKLSSLLSYMLYDCKGDEVSLEKELNVMKDYTDLEKERYGKRIDISWCNEGKTADKFIAPLLILPFLENAFKHGASEQLEKPWLSVDILTDNEIFRCKIVNSKNTTATESNGGIGIQNVKKRLNFIYPGRHEIAMIDEGNFYVVSLKIGFTTLFAKHSIPGGSNQPSLKNELK